MDTTFLDQVDVLLERVNEGLPYAAMVEVLAVLATTERKRITSTPDQDAYFDNVADMLGDSPYAIIPDDLNNVEKSLWEALKDQGLILRNRNIGGYRLTPTGWARLETIRKARKN